MISIHDSFPTMSVAFSLLLSHYYSIMLILATRLLHDEHSALRVAKALLNTVLSLRRQHHITPVCYISYNSKHGIYSKHRLRTFFLWLGRCKPRMFRSPAISRLFARFYEHSTHVPKVACLRACIHNDHDKRRVGHPR